MTENSGQLSKTPEERVNEVFAKLKDAFEKETKDPSDTKNKDFFKKCLDIVKKIEELRKKDLGELDCRMLEKEMTSFFALFVTDQKTRSSDPAPESELFDITAKLLPESSADRESLSKIEQRIIKDYGYNFKNVSYRTILNYKWFLDNMIGTLEDVFTIFSKNTEESKQESVVEIVKIFDNVKRVLAEQEKSREESKKVTEEVDSEGTDTEETAEQAAVKSSEEAIKEDAEEFPVEKREDSRVHSDESQHSQVNSAKPSSDAVLNDSVQETAQQAAKDSEKATEEADSKGIDTEKTAQQATEKTPEKLAEEADSKSDGPNRTMELIELQEVIEDYKNIFRVIEKYKKVNLSDMSQYEICERNEYIYTVTTDLYNHVFGNEDSLLVKVGSEIYKILELTKDEAVEKKLNGYLDQFTITYLQDIIDTKHSKTNKEFLEKVNVSVKEICNIILDLEKNENVTLTKEGEVNELLRLVEQMDTVLKALTDENIIQYTGIQTESREILEGSIAYKFYSEAKSDDIDNIEKTELREKFQNLRKLTDEARKLVDEESKASEGNTDDCSSAVERLKNIVKEMEVATGEQGQIKNIVDFFTKNYYSRMKLIPSNITYEGRRCNSLNEAVKLLVEVENRIAQAMRVVRERNGTMLEKGATAERATGESSEEPVKKANPDVRRFSIGSMSRKSEEETPDPTASDAKSADVADDVAVVNIAVNTKPNSGYTGEERYDEFVKLCYEVRNGIKTINEFKEYIKTLNVEGFAKQHNKVVADKKIQKDFQLSEDLVSKIGSIVSDKTTTKSEESQKDITMAAMINNVDSVACLSQLTSDQIQLLGKLKNGHEQFEDVAARLKENQVFNDTPSLRKNKIDGRCELIKLPGRPGETIPIKIGKDLDFGKIIAHMGTGPGFILAAIEITAKKEKIFDLNRAIEETKINIGNQDIKNFEDLKKFFESNADLMKPLINCPGVENIQAHFENFVHANGISASIGFSSVKTDNAGKPNIPSSGESVEEEEVKEGEQSKQSEERFKEGKKTWLQRGQERKGVFIGAHRGE